MTKNKNFKLIVIRIVMAFYLCLCSSNIAESGCDNGGGEGTPGSGGATVPGDFNYPSNFLFGWSDENLDTIPRNSSTTLVVVGGFPDFTWTISGTGFWFDSAYTLRTKETKSREIIVYTDSDACGSATITVIDKFGNTTQGTVSADITLEWPSGNPTEINPGQSITISINGNAPPFTWAVSGSGFSIDNSATGTTNTLTADCNATGTATITVTDICNNTVTGSVAVNESGRLAWDSENSDELFSDNLPSNEAGVSIKGGKSPYSWEVSEGFTLTCTTDCSTSNTVTYLGNTNYCTATITVTDACGKTTTGYVRRPGYWSPWYRCLNTTLCNGGKCPESIVDLGDHKTKVTSCTNEKLEEYNCACPICGSQYTVHRTSCGGIFEAYVQHWHCN